MRVLAIGTLLLWVATVVSYGLVFAAVGREALVLSGLLTVATVLAVFAEMHALRARARIERTDFITGLRGVAAKNEGIRGELEIVSTGSRDAPTFRVNGETVVELPVTNETYAFCATTKKSLSHVEDGDRVEVLGRASMQMQPGDTYRGVVHTYTFEETAPVVLLVDRTHTTGT